MAQYQDPDVFVALDESVGDVKMLQQYFGRSLARTPCVQRAAFLRGTQYSVLPALTTQGIIALDIFEGSITKDQFLAFIREQVVSTNFIKAESITKFMTIAKTQTFPFWQVNWRTNCCNIIIVATSW
jgi:hypothetical protein